MKGSKIVLNPNSQGLRTEGTITDTSKPGTLMEKVPATAAVGGRFSWRARSSTEGAHAQIAVLTENWVQGKIYSDAYAANERCFIYYPKAGDDLNLILLDIAGTGDAAIAIGDLFGVTTSGKLKRNNSFGACPFESNETVAAGLADDYLLWVTYRGDNA
jgi:hypothetical protein